MVEIEIGLVMPPISACPKATARGTIEGSGGGSSYLEPSLLEQPEFQGGDDRIVIRINEPFEQYGQFILSSGRLAGMRPAARICDSLTRHAGH